MDATEDHLHQDYRAEAMPETLALEEGQEPIAAALSEAEVSELMSAEPEATSPKVPTSYIAEPDLN